MSPVRETCVPPQNSRERADVEHAHLVAVLLAEQHHRARLLRLLDRHDLRARRRVLQDLGVHPRFHLADLARRSSACRARSRSASCRRRPASPFCCTCAPSTSRSALCMRCVTEWLRMVRARSAMSTRASTLSPSLSAPVFSAPWWPKTSAWIFCVSATSKVPRGADQLAAVADLAAGLGVERRAVEHHRRRTRRSSAPAPGAPSR